MDWIEAFIYVVVLGFAFGFGQGYGRRRAQRKYDKASRRHLAATVQSVQLIRNNVNLMRTDAAFKMCNELILSCLTERVIVEKDGS
mgnify:CR=1 FL=1